MAAMLLARSATASTGWCNTSSEQRHGPASTGATDAYTRPSAFSNGPLSCPSPVASPRAGPPRAADAGGQVSQGTARKAGEPATPPVIRLADVIAALSFRGGSGAMRTHLASTGRRQPAIGERTRTQRTEVKPANGICLPLDTYDRLDILIQGVQASVVPSSTASSTTAGRRSWSRPSLVYSAMLQSCPFQPISRRLERTTV